MIFICKAVSSFGVDCEISNEIMNRLQFDLGLIRLHLID